MNALTSIKELRRNVSTSPYLIKSINGFGGKDFVIHSFLSVVNTLSVTPEGTNKFRLPLTLSKVTSLVHVIQCLNLYNPKVHCFFSLLLTFLARSDKSDLMKATKVKTTLAW